MWGGVMSVSEEWRSGGRSVKCVVWSEEWRGE